MSLKKKKTQFQKNKPKTKKLTLLYYLDTYKRNYRYVIVCLV